jgi:hypothetical protein
MIELQLRKSLYCLISLIALVSLLVTILCSMQYATPRTIVDEPIQDDVTFAQALQALSARH